MARSPLEVADVFRAHGADLLWSADGAVSSAKQRVLSDLEACRTAKLGGHVVECEDRGHRRISYNSCRNRHCPKCQGHTRADWLDARKSDLLPVEYFHVVFTVPQEIAAIALQNKKEVYAILLHSWGQNLLHHPHMACVVPGGGLSSDGLRRLAMRGESSGMTFRCSMRSD